MPQPLKKNSLKKALQDIIKRDTGEWLEKQSGWTGDSDGNVSAGNGNIYVRLRNQRVHEVFNTIVPERADIPVTIGRSRALPDVWQVIWYRKLFDVPPTEESIKNHYKQHMYGAEDMVPIERKQIIQLTVIRLPSKGPFYVRLYGDVRQTPTGIKKISTQNINLASHVPATKARYIAIESNNSGAISVIDGTEFASPSIASTTYMPVPASGKYTRAWVLLYAGQTAIQDKDIVVPMPPDYNPAVTTVLSLDDLLDVNAPSPLDLQLLGFDFYSQEWIPMDPFDLQATIHGLGSVVPAFEDETVALDASSYFALYNLTWQDIYDLFYPALISDFSGDENFEAMILGWGFVDSVALDSVDGEIVLFNGTTGGTVKNTGSGITLAHVLSGWKPVSQTWTYASADDPVYQIYVNGDVTANADYKLGNKVLCTNNSTSFYGFIVKVGAYDSGNNRTPVDLYGGTDYDLANSAITAPYIGKVKSPDGFPLNPDKWSVVTTDTGNQTQASPTQNTWYNLGSLSITIPIGLWSVSYKVLARVQKAAATSANMVSTLSTANNSESDSDFSCTLVIGGASGTLILLATQHAFPKILTLTTKTTYYLNGRTTTPTVDSIGHRGDSGTTVVRAVCAYL